MIKPDTLLLSHQLAWPTNIPESPPSEFKAQLGRRRDSWKRASMVLWLVSAGFSIGKEIQTIIAAHLGIDSRTRGLRLAIQRLSEHGVLCLETYQQHFWRRRIKINVVCLSEKGQEIAHHLGWEPVETEWERMKRLHEKNKKDEGKHTLMTMLFTYHARLRGYQAGVMPAVSWNNRSAPDALVILGKEKSAFVEVETKIDNARMKTSKWNNAFDQQGQIFACCRNPRDREKLKNFLAAKIAYSPGLLTDLKTLFLEGREHPYCDLWLEELKN